MKKGTAAIFCVRHSIGKKLSPIIAMTSRILFSNKKLLLLQHRLYASPFLHSQPNTAQKVELQQFRLTVTVSLLGCELWSTLWPPPILARFCASACLPRLVPYYEIVIANRYNIRFLDGARTFYWSLEIANILHSSIHGHKHCSSCCSPVAYLIQAKRRNQHQSKNAIKWTS